MKIYDKIGMTLTSFQSLLSFLFLTLSFKVIHQGHAVTQAHHPTAVEKRVTFGYAVKCTSAARWDTSFLALQKGCASPMAHGPVISPPANVSACSSWHDTASLKLPISHILFYLAR